MPDRLPIHVAHLFRPLDEKLIALLKSLSPEEWHIQTVAKLWKVKDVAAHLLDGNLRLLSMQRDQYFGEPSITIDSYQTLVDWLNQLNADWVKANKRISPSVMIMLHEVSGKQACDYYESVDLEAPAIFPVSWAGENESKNWFHIAREYMEKWLHQQQIRDAVNKEGILNEEFYTPFLETAMRALPYTFRNINAEEGTSIRIAVRHEVLDAWYLVQQNSSWILTKEEQSSPDASLLIEGHAAWKLFSKSWRAQDAAPFVNKEGDIALADHALNMVTFMA